MPDVGKLAPEVVAVEHKKWGKRHFVLADGLACGECGSKQLNVEVTDLGDVELMCEFCGTELVHIPCHTLMSNPENADQ